MHLPCLNLTPLFNTLLKHGVEICYPTTALPARKVDLLMDLNKDHSLVIIRQDFPVDVEPDGA